MEVSIAWSHQHSGRVKSRRGIVKINPADAEPESSGSQGFVPPASAGCPEMSFEDVADAQRRILPDGYAQGPYPDREKLNGKKPFWWVSQGTQRWVVFWHTYWWDLFLKIL